MSPARPYVFSVVAARATERGLQSAGVLVSEGPVLRSSTAETERSLRSRLAAFCRGPGSHTAEGGDFGSLRRVCAVLRFLRDKSRAPATIFVGALNTYQSLGYCRLSLRDRQPGE
jgi:hypothetical protein